MSKSAPRTPIEMEPVRSEHRPEQEWNAALAAKHKIQTISRLPNDFFRNCENIHWKALDLRRIFPTWNNTNHFTTQRMLDRICSNKSQVDSGSLNCTLLTKSRNTLTVTQVSMFVYCGFDNAHISVFHGARRDWIRWNSPTELVWKRTPFQIIKKYRDLVKTFLILWKWWSWRADANISNSLRRLRIAH